uniref:Synuclein, alpha interacting protein n=1 Tax=Scleropages formosus TaxID=113540 RepID=A0A8C9VG07_SCLFO
MSTPMYTRVSSHSPKMSYSVTSLKNIPELCRRNDSQGEERQVPPMNWSRGIPSHGGNGIKPAGIADVHSKFRPVKRVSPLKHQPEVSDTEADSKGQNAEGSKGETSDKANVANVSCTDSQGFKGKGGGPLFGELEHYDLDMDEILDVPYIKSSQQMATLPRVAAEKKPLGSGAGDRGHVAKTTTLPHSETLGAMTQYCVLSPVKGPEVRKSKSVESEFIRQPGGGHGHVQSGLGCSAASEAEKLLPSRTFQEPRVHKAGVGIPGGQPPMFPVPGCTGAAWSSPRAHGECDEDAKKAQNIINIIRGGQISLLPHLAADNLELIRDEEGNNLLHISASQGHAECLQHLTSLMGEDCLNERNSEQLSPAGLAIKNGHLECVRWMVSETEAIAELSCTRDHPSLIHYAARYGQEKILLWLLQFMQEQAISLDELDGQGNSAVHVAAQHGHLGCIQTLVEYGSNVTVQNQQGDRPSQTAERHGHTTCSRYLVVVETCMSLASQVVKLTKQLNEQTAERMTLQNQMQQLLESPHLDGSPSLSPSSFVPPLGSWPEMTLTVEAAAGDGQWVLRQRDVDTDAVLRQLLGKEIAEKVCTQERLSLEFRDGSREAARRPGAALTGRRELKLARLKQLMQRSLSESDSDAYPGEEQKHSGAVGRPDRPRQLAVADGEEQSAGSHPPARRHGAAAERKFSFAHGTSKSVDGYNPSPTSDGSDHDHEPKSETPGDGQKVTTSPKSALKSPSSRRKTSQNLKLRVTFDEPVVHKEGQEGEAKGAHGKDAEKGGARTSAGSESGEMWKRPFGTFRSIMESLGGNQNSNNSNQQTASAAKQCVSGASHGSPGRKTWDAKSSPAGPSKSKGKASAV